MGIITDIEFKNDLEDVAALFPFKERIGLDAEFSEGLLKTSVTLGEKRFDYQDRIETFEELLFKRQYKRAVKNRLYEALSAKTGITLPWGSLTGIRPVRLFNQLCIEKGKAEAEKYFLEAFKVSPEKTGLVKEISAVQEKYIINDLMAADLYIGIPFCKGRCSYCSFFSADIEKSGSLAGLYTEALIKEVLCAREIIKGFRLNSVYVGGGTPSSLPPEELRKILQALSGLEPTEFTVEAGRPDSICREILDVLKSCNVGRICINPQSIKDETLKLVGRRHTFSDILKAYHLAKGYGFSINMDVIAGLPGESPEDFANTVDAVCGLFPDNITVHTLALKQGSVLKQSSYSHGDGTDVMLSYAYEKLHKCGYTAYYMYRQKNTAGNLENAGYSFPGRECRYNIDNMEDAVSVLACGAGAVSKRVFSAGRIERLGSPKDIPTYLNGIENICVKKKTLFTEPLI